MGCGGIDICRTGRAGVVSPTARVSEPRHCLETASRTPRPNAKEIENRVVRSNGRIAFVHLGLRIDCLHLALICRRREQAAARAVSTARPCFTFTPTPSLARRPSSALRISNHIQFNPTSETIMVSWNYKEMARQWRDFYGRSWQRDKDANDAGNPIGKSPPEQFWHRSDGLQHLYDQWPAETPSTTPALPLYLNPYGPWCTDPTQCT